MPSRRHDFVAWALPRLRRSRELDTEPAERARVERWHATLAQGLDRRLPTRLVPRFSRRFSVVVEELARFPVHVITPRHLDPQRTVMFLHGGGYMAPADPFHLVHVTRLATTLRARIVLPDYPLAPEHTWRDSFDPLTDLAARWAADSRLTMFGDSAGGGYALALAMALRDRGGPQPSELLLYSPWVDLTSSAPDTPAYDAVDPWLFLGKVRTYAEWWAGSPVDLARPEVSPALADLAGLPRALMLYGTRDLLAPGCRLLRRRAGEAGWDLTAIEERDLLHVYGLFPLVPEARRAFGQAVGFLRSGG